MRYKHSFLTGLSSPSPLTHSSTSQLTTPIASAASMMTTSTTTAPEVVALFPHSPLTALNKSATLPAG